MIDLLAAYALTAVFFGFPIYVVGYLGYRSYVFIKERNYHG